MKIECSACKKQFERDVPNHSRIRCDNCGRRGIVTYMDLLSKRTRARAGITYDAYLSIPPSMSELKKFRFLALVEINSRGVDLGDSVDRWKMPFKGKDRFKEREDVKILFVFPPKELEKCIPPQRSKDEASH